MGADKGQEGAQGGGVLCCMLAMAVVANTSTNNKQRTTLGLWVWALLVSIEV